MVLRPERLRGSQSAYPPAPGRAPFSLEDTDCGWLAALFYAQQRALAVVLSWMPSQPFQLRRGSLERAAATLSTRFLLPSVDLSPSYFFVFLSKFVFGETRTSTTPVVTETMLSFP